MILSKLHLYTSFNYSARVRMRVCVNLIQALISVGLLYGRDGVQIAGVVQRCQFSVN